MTRNVFSTFASLLLAFATVTNIFGLEINSSGSVRNSTPTANPTNNRTALPNPVLLNLDKGCQPENLNAVRFDPAVDTKQRIAFCEAVQEIARRIDGQWSPALKSEMNEIWGVFLNENVKIYPMKKNVSSKIVAAAQAFPNNESSAGFNAGLHLRLEKSRAKSFFLSFMHEMRHVYDFYAVWKNRSKLTEAELEKRSFRLMSKIYQEMPDAERPSGIPSFWSDKWKNLSPAKMERQREERIEGFMRGNGFYKHLVKSPEKYTIGYAQESWATGEISAATLPEDRNDKSGKDEKLPARLALTQTRDEVPQNVKEISFAPAKPADNKNPDQLLEAAIANEKNLYRRMDNFVYDQSFELQCWKKQRVTENYAMKNLVARTASGATLFQNVAHPASAKLPACVRDLDSIKTDVAETFWAAPYLDQMPVRYVGSDLIDGIPVARYTVLQPSYENYKQLAAAYPHIENFRVFVGTIFVSVEDAQIIKFWGTSFPKSSVTGSQTVNADYCATSIRQKLATGVWVTTALNTVAVNNQDEKMNPFSYVAKYHNYRQATSDVQILDDDAVAAK